MVVFKVAHLLAICVAFILMFRLAEANYIPLTPVQPNEVGIRRAPRGAVTDKRILFPHYSSVTAMAAWSVFNPCESGSMNVRGNCITISDNPTFDDGFQLG